MNGWVGGWTQTMDEWIYGWYILWMDEWMDTYDGWIQWMGGWLHTVDWWIHTMDGYIYIYIYIYTVYTPTGHFIRYTLLVPGWTPFVFRTALILRGIDSTKCWKHFSEILVHIDMNASRSCCRFVVCTSWCESPVTPHPKGALLDRDLVTVE